MTYDTIRKKQTIKGMPLTHQGIDLVSFIFYFNKFSILGFEKYY